MMAILPSLRYAKPPFLHLLLFAFFLPVGLYAQAPTVASFSPASMTMRTPVIITGTNFTNATAVTFGGTNAASFTVNSSTQITAIVGMGTSGAVKVSNASGTGTGGNATYITAAATPLAAAVSRVISDFNGFWSSTATSAVASEQPDTHHNMLAFANNGTVYTTGINDLAITLANLLSPINFGDYRALPINAITGNTVGNANYLALGTKIDGDANASNYLSPAVSTLKVRDVLTDGTKGLDLGTGVTNISSSMILDFAVSNIVTAAISDAKPDILVTQIASPTTVVDIYAFTDANGNIVGNPVQANLSAIDAIGTSKLDLFTLPTNTAYADAMPIGNGTPGTRDIRMIAFKLSDFGITTANAGSVAKFKLMPGGDSDPAFIAYNASAFLIPSPVITSQPASVTVCPGQLFDSATFSVSATGSGLSYQWKKNGVSIPGATASSYHIASVTTAHFGAYTVVVTNSAGSATSEPAYLNTVVLLQPSAIATCLNTSALLGTSAGGLNVSYQWYSNTANNNTTGTLISGATTANYAPPTNVAGTKYYYAVAKANSLTCAAVSTNAVAVTVNPLSVAGTASVSKTICSGTSTGMTLSGQTGTIQWQQSANGTSGWTDVIGGSGATTTVYITAFLTTNTYFRAAVTSGECSTANSNSILITVTPVSNAGTVSANQTICYNTAATVSVTGTVGTIQWQESPNGTAGWTNVSTGSGATTVSYTTATLTTAKYFRAAATNGICSAVYSDVVAINISPLPNAGTISANQNVCYNSTSAISVSGTVGTIQWQQSPNGISGWANVTGGSGATTNAYTTPALTEMTYYRAVVTSGNCTAATSAAATITVSNSNNWTGALSTDWNTAGNWSCNQIPNVVIDANIPVTGSGRYPVLASGTGICRNINIASGANITISNSGVIEIARAINNSGTFTTIDGAVHFIGASPQQIPANVFASNAIKNLTIHNASGVTMLGANSLTGILDVKAGNFATGNLLTLKSNAATTAMIAPVAGSVSGTMTVERYIPSRRAFRFLSAPTDGGTIRSNWQENGPAIDPVGLGTDITGVGGAANGFDTSGSNNPSLYTYLNNNTAGGSAWVAATSTNVNMAAGVAYRMLVRGDRTVNQTVNSAPSTATTLRTTGTIRTGNVAVTDLNPVAGGFSLIGNPYQAPVDMGLLLNDSSLLERNFYYMWDATSNTRGAYVTVNLANNSNNVSGSSADRYLQPGQACFIKTAIAGTPSLVFKENYKHLTTATTPVYKQSAVVEGEMRITLYESGALAANAAAADGLVIRFGDSYSNDIDGFDAPKPVNQDENMGRMANSKIYSYESRFWPTAADVLPISITQYRNTNYTFKIGVSGINNAVPYLRDHYAGTTTELVNGQENTVAFALNSAIPASSIENRFDIVFAATALATSENDFSKDIRIYPNPVTENNFEIALPDNALAFSVQITNVLGQEVYNENPIVVNNKITVAPKMLLKSGVYIVTVKNGKESAVKKITVK